MPSAELNGRQQSERRHTLQSKRDPSGQRTATATESRHDSSQREEQRKQHFVVHRIQLLSRVISEINTKSGSGSVFSSFQALAPHPRRPARYRSGGGSKVMSYGASEKQKYQQKGRFDQAM
jgi:hypothetical protein